MQTVPCMTTDLKVIIAGGRKYVGTPDDLKLLWELHNKYNFIRVVSGKATGADKFGEDFADLAGIPKAPFPADWKDLSEPCVLRYNYKGEPYNALAGHKRNERMARYADALILFKGNKGTKDMRDMALKHNLIILYDFAN